MKNKNIIGALYILLAVIFYGLYGILSRFIGESFGSFSQNAVRSIIIVFILFSNLLLNKNIKWIKIVKKDIKWFLIWGLSGSITMVLLFVAFNNLPISTAYFLFYSTMIIAGFFWGWILFKEKLDVMKIFSLFLIIIGLLLIFSIDIESNKIIFLIPTLLAGFLIGTWNTFSKKISNNYSNNQMVLFGSVITVLVGTAGSLISKETLPTFVDPAWVWISVFALVELLATVLTIKGFKNLEAQIASSIMPMEIVFATLFSFIFFKETLSLSMLIGGLCIIVAATLPSIYKMIQKKDF